MFGLDKFSVGFQNICGIPLAYEVSVGAVIFRKTDEGKIEYLLLRYPHGHWDYVKGHIEKGETQEDTLRRETLEESGLKDIEIVKGFRKYTRYYYTAKGTELIKRKKNNKGIWIYKTVYFYLAQSHTFDVLISDEHIGYAWLSYEEASKKLTFEAARTILTQAQAFLHK
jgi:bis(5'-nucleosidyl)-tetraphosphatase